ncbi:ROK family protein [uncultured Tessaracoccus sp.]|uniref:ROK family protein n=1 Tax=uncultured Tessaracoccus sp. TaxID=905023 RepID=UPI0025E189AE|nr:ROK family protein [uncultured Tessaracoccus sp.]
MRTTHVDEVSTRAERTQRVLTALRAARSATRTQLAEACGLSRPTVAGILADLEAAGTVTTLDAATDGGRPAKRYGFAPTQGLVLALDVTRDWVTVVVATHDGTVRDARVCPLSLPERDARLAQLVTHVRDVLAPARNGHGTLLAATVSTTGVVEPSGRIVRSDLVPQWTDLDLGAALVDALGCPVRVENDINASAYGEFAVRAAAGELSPTDDLLYMNFAAGLLTGLVLGGDLHRGHTWNAGEIVDVLGDLTLTNRDDAPDEWAARAATAVGPLCVVVDPRLVVVATPPPTVDRAIPALRTRLNALRPPSAPPLPLDATELGLAAAVTGSLALALRDADEALLGAPPPAPVTLRHRERIHDALQEGLRTTMSDEQQHTPRKALRVGVVGVGARAPLALNAEESQVPATIVAACEPHPLARDRVRDRLRKDPDSILVASSVAEMLEADLDVAFVTSPDDTHADITCELLEAGVAVYLEKPLAIHLDDATRILETAHRTGTKLYVGHNMRHMNVVRTMRDLIRSGRIGEVKAIWCRHFVGAGGDFYFKDWHATREHGTGLLLQKAAHDIDVMHWLADSRTTEVVGMGDLMVYDRVTDRADHSDELMGDWYSIDNWPPLSQRGLNEVIDVEDLSMVLMRMESGVLASYQQCHFTPDYWRNYTVIGTEGRIENFGDGEGGHIKLWNKRTIYNPDGDEQFPILGDAEGHSDADKLIVDEFLRFVAHGTRTDTNPLGAWASVAAGIQATESLRDGSTPREVPGLPDELVTYFTNNQLQ